MMTIKPEIALLASLARLPCPVYLCRFYLKPGQCKMLAALLATAKSPQPGTVTADDPHACSAFQFAEDVQPQN